MPDFRRLGKMWDPSQEEVAPAPQAQTAMTLPAARRNAVTPEAAREFSKPMAGALTPDARQAAMRISPMQGHAQFKQLNDMFGFGGLSKEMAARAGNMPGGPREIGGAGGGNEAVDAFTQRLRTTPAYFGTDPQNNQYEQDAFAGGTGVAPTENVPGSRAPAPQQQPPPAMPPPINAPVFERQEQMGTYAMGKPQTAEPRKPMVVKKGVVGAPRRGR